MDLPLLHSIDSPLALGLVDPLALRIDGWVASPPPSPPVVGIEVRVAGVKIAETFSLFLRPDVIDVLRLPPRTATGFTVLGHVPHFTAGAEAELEFHACFVDGRVTPFARRPVMWINTDYRQKPYGVLLQSHATDFRRRGDIYGSGPSQAERNEASVDLLCRFLGPPPLRVLDVGCGFGAYGRRLIARGYDWFGVEIDSGDCAELARLGLPHQQVDGSSLPLADNSFDAALCIEVLEHIPEPRTFLAEVRRVAPRLLVSVPNIELLAYLSPYQAVPWHMLEADHQNFFTRWGLGALLRQFYSHVEVISYSPMPLPTVEGTALDYHLLAIARAARDSGSHQAASADFSPVPSPTT